MKISTIQITMQQVKDLQDKNNTLSEMVQILKKERDDKISETISLKEQLVLQKAENQAFAVKVKENVEKIEQLFDFKKKYEESLVKITILNQELAETNAKISNQVAQPIDPSILIEIPDSDIVLDLLREQPDFLMKRGHVIFFRLCSREMIFYRDLDSTMFWCMQDGGIQQRYGKQQISNMILSYIDARFEYKVVQESCLESLKARLLVC